VAGFGCGPDNLILLSIIPDGSPAVKEDIERSVEDLAARASLTLANASRHLQLLRRASLVEGRRDGKRVYYRLAGDEVVVGLLAALSRVGERNSAEIARVMASYFRARDEFEPVSRNELLDRLRCGAATVLDVRPEDEFASGHLPDALNIPLSQLERRLAELPPDQEIVAYCRGPWCVLSFEAVALLRQRGYRARRLEYGFPEWKRQGCRSRAPICHKAPYADNDGFRAGRRATRCIGALAVSVSISGQPGTSPASHRRTASDRTRSIARRSAIFARTSAR
jgi:rhodanese-related sulfurtransferase